MNQLVGASEADPDLGFVARLAGGAGQAELGCSLCQAMLPSPLKCGLGLRGFYFSRPPMGSLALRPGNSLTIQKMALSVAFISFVFSTNATQTTGL